MSKSIFFFMAIIFSALFYSTSLKDKTSPYITPPGTVRLDSNLFIDKTEITNFSWLEYMHWTQGIFGKNSQEYAFVLPDTSVWLTLDSNYHNLKSIYLRNPKYRTYPVVGISYIQALSYSAWRSDRVMELILIKNKVIKSNDSKNIDSVFTITKYFNGEYNGIAVNPNFMSYPKYNLPTPQLYKSIQKKADAINNANINYCKPKNGIDAQLVGCYCPLHHLASQKENMKAVIPILSTMTLKCKRPIVTHLKSNVSEMTFINGLLYGYNFEKSCEDRENLLWRSSGKQNASTGFRNVCTYETWDSRK